MDSSNGVMVMGAMDGEMRMDQAGRAARAWCTLAAALALLLGAGAAQAQTSTTLISTDGQGSTSFWNFTPTGEGRGQSIFQPFRTGSGAGGYTVTSVDVRYSIVGTLDSLPIKWAFILRAQI